jgi:release factor glutamine methyltransferase
VNSIPENVFAAARSVNNLMARSSDTPRLDAQVVMAEVLGRSRSWVAAHPEFQLNGEQQEKLEGIKVRLGKGEPLPYVLGKWEFFNLEFKVTPAVLIPRPETELLVEHAIQYVNHRDLDPGSCEILEFGTGSGCIAVSLAVNIPAAHLVAFEVSPAALEVARENAAKHKVSARIEFILSDFFSQPIQPSRFDLVAANPPYIPTTSLASLPVSRWEPRIALDGGADGLAFSRQIINEAPSRMHSSACLLIEMESTQGSALRQRAETAFPCARISIYKDLAGHDRLLEVLT